MHRGLRVYNVVLCCYTGRHNVQRSMFVHYSAQNNAHASKLRKYTIQYDSAASHGNKPVQKTRFIYL